jgi:type III pantothenate kinase
MNHMLSVHGIESTAMGSVLLTLDRGNTTLDAMWHGVSPARRRLDPEDGAAVQAFLAHCLPDQVVGLTVVAGGLDRIEDLLAAKGSRMLRAGRDLPCPLILAYSRPEDLGVDRWVGALAAWRLFGASLVVDCGTAVTLNLVDGEGVFRGGAIAPGAKAMVRGLAAAAPGLPLAALEPEFNLPATDTVESVGGGVQVGFRAMVDGLIDAVLPAANPATTIVVTGGWASLYLRGTRRSCRLVPDLIHQGLRCLVEPHVSNS